MGYLVLLFLFPALVLPTMASPEVTGICHGLPAHGISEGLGIRQAGTFGFSS